MRPRASDRRVLSAMERTQCAPWGLHGGKDAQPNGGRMAGIADAWGNEWYLAGR